MITQLVTTVPDRAALRALYDEAVVEINTKLRANSLNNNFYAKIGDAVFEAGCLALSDAITNTRRMHTVCAPVGAGKTSFSYALIVAVTRYAENRADAPYGSVFVVEEREKADEVFKELNTLSPGKVAIWTTDHDTHCKEPEKVKEPGERFTQDALQHYPIIVVTRSFYLRTNGHKARTFLSNGAAVQRALTVVDERPNEAPTIEVTLAEAQTIRKALVEERPETKPYMDALFSFMEPFNYAEPNKLFRPKIEWDHAKLVQELGWFTTKEADFIAQSVNIHGIKNLFAFVEALIVGRACIATNGVLPYFFAYQERRIIDKTAGVVLLDGTADIDGVSNIVPWRFQTETPKARYDNLEIVHVPQHTKTRLNKYFKTAPNQRAYVNWMVEIVKQHMKPGEKGLVICKKVLFDDEHVPQWEQGDERFKKPETYTKQYAWTIDGRELCATHWGTGIGSNVWQDAAVVFLFDEFFIPRRIAASTTQSYRGHLANEGDLGAMRTLHSKAYGVDSIAEGHNHRWTKQLALRGKARFYDDNGVCGKQRLVVGSDLRRFMASAPKLFPGAKIRTIGAPTDNTTLATKIIKLLNYTTKRVLTTKVLSKLIERPWRSISRNIMTPKFRSNLDALGWRYVSHRGKLGSRFERVQLVGA
jgi:hypothetical protein